MSTHRHWMAGAAFVAALICAGPVKAAESAEVMSMDAYLWKNRPVLVFVPDAGHPLLEAQTSALARERAGLVDREIVVIAVVGDRVTIGGRAAPALAASELRRRYRVDRGEAVALLVGKDGGVKMRETGALTAESLYPTIDAMPMRRQEMRAQGGAGN